jgi:hypothetical protein
MELAPAGQQASPACGAVIGVCEQTTLQRWTVPVCTSSVQGSPSSQSVGQLRAPLRSQVSVPSTMPLPQLLEQSLSLVVSHWLGQQPSPLRHSVLGVSVQTTLQDSAVPVAEACRQLSVLMHVQLEGGSQVSDDSTTLLPQTALQSVSRVALALLGQQPSAAPTLVIFSSTQVVPQPLPASATRMHGSELAQLVGHAPA